MTTLTQDAVNPLVPQAEEDRLAWLAMALTPALGPKRILDAMNQLEAPGQLFALPLTALEAMKLPAESAQFIFDGKARRVAEEELALVAAQGAMILTFSCPAYPERLKEIYDPPPVLWVRGDVSLLARPSIAVVGTRHPSPYGPGGAAAADCQRNGSRHRHLCAQGRVGSPHAHGGRLGNRDRRDLSQGK